MSVYVTLGDDQSLNRTSLVNQSGNPINPINAPSYAHRFNVENNYGDNNFGGNFRNLYGFNDYSPLVNNVNIGYNLNEMNNINNLNNTMNNGQFNSNFYALEGVNYENSYNIYSETIPQQSQPAQFHIKGIYFN